MSKNGLELSKLSSNLCIYNQFTESRASAHQFAHKHTYLYRQAPIHINTLLASRTYSQI